MQLKQLQNVATVKNIIKAHIALKNKVQLSRKSSYELIRYFFSLIYCTRYYEIKGCYIGDLAHQLGLSRGQLNLPYSRKIKCPSYMKKHLESVMRALKDLGYIGISSNNMVLTSLGQSIA